MNTHLKEGDKVKYKDGDPRIFTVYAVYEEGISLSLADYPDVEQDNIIDPNEVILI